MRIFYSLTKRQLLAITGVNRFFCENIKEKKRFRCLWSAIAVIFLALCLYWFRINIHICMSFQSSQGILNNFLKPLITVSAVMIFLSAFMKGSGILYLDKSVFLLFSYPINIRTIVLAKLSVIYLWNVCISIILLGIPLLRYESLQEERKIFCMVDFGQILILPVIPTLVGVLLGSMLYRRFKKLFQARFYAKGIVYLALFIVFFAFMIFFFDSVDLDTLCKGVIDKAEFFNRIVFSHDHRSIIFLLGSISAGVILTEYVVRTYKKTCEKAQIYSENRKKVRIDYKRHTKLRALFFREWRRYFSIPVYLLNTMLGIVSLILFTIYICLDTDHVILYLKWIGMSSKVENIFVFPAFAAGFMILLSNVTYAGISVEGKQRELLKSYPVSIEELLFAKYLLHLSLTLPVIFICAVLMGAAFYMKIWECILLFVLPSVFSAFAGALGLCINLIFPNYEWENVAYIVKQSLSAILTILLSIFTVGAALWITIRFFGTEILAASYIVALFFALLTGLIGILLKRISKIF